MEHQHGSPFRLRYICAILLYRIHTIVALEFIYVFMSVNKLRENRNDDAQDG